MSFAADGKDRSEWTSADTVPPPPETQRAPADKACGCGASHDAYEWLQLRRVGVMGDEVERLELRDCPAPCLSTLAVTLCGAPGCDARSTYDTEDGPRCGEHEREWHLSDRADFADEWAREDRRVRELEWAR